MKPWTCITYIELKKDLTRAGFYKGIDALGNVRYIVRTRNFGELEASEEVTKRKGNELYRKLISEGYEKIWTRIA